jgi:poly-gamma-glutamate system protein
MKTTFRTIDLVVVAAVAIGLAVIVQTYGTASVLHERADAMRAAERLTAAWYERIGELKAERNLVDDATAHIPYGYMIGDDYTEMSTTLGSLSAKETADNPQFGALMARLLVDAGIDSTSTVGVTVSGSFPTLAIASLAALQTLGCNVVLISSVGASTYGANQPQATWLDMESRLREYGGLRYRSAMVTPGAESDRGEGLTENGQACIAEAAQRNGYELIQPASLQASIAAKMELLRNVDLLINIGGNQASLGACPHALSIPNGYQSDYSPCHCTDRGIIARMAARDVPFIELLNIRDLAVRYGVDLEASDTNAESERLFFTRRTQPAAAAGSLAVIGLAMLGLGRFNGKRRRIAPVK